MMEALDFLAKYGNVLLLPAGLAFWKLARSVERVEDFMRASAEDRKALWDTVRPMEREMLKRGMIDA